MKRSGVGLVFILVPLIAAMCVHDFAGEYTGKRVGWAVAHFDVWGSDYRFKVLGLPEPWDREATRVFAEKYGIKRDRIAFCTVSEWDLGYAEGYNNVSIPAIKAKYSSGVYADAMKESVKLYLQTHQMLEARREYILERMKQYENQ